MKQPGFKNEDNRWRLPHLGQRIIKTAIAVFICLIIYYLRGYGSGSMPTESAITAIICMQHDVHDTGRFALNRFAGTMIGCVWGILLFLLLNAVPALGREPLFLYALMGLGVALSLYTTVILHVTQSSSLAAIIFLCIVISFPDVEAPFYSVLMRVIDVFVGTLVAVFVNTFRLPRKKNRSSVFFIHTSNLVPDRFAQISPRILFQLNYLYNDGAKICLMSEHAPAFFTVQMRSVKLNTPLIVMDGAAIYDAVNSAYLQKETMNIDDSTALRSCMNELGISYFTYTIHNNRTCIFHHGPLSDEEQTVYDSMKHSPYRDYLEGDIYHPSEIVYFKIIGDQETVSHAEQLLQHLLSRETIRSVQRYQAGTKDIIGLYIYSSTATMIQAKDRLMRILWKEDTLLTSREIYYHPGYRSEHDAVYLLHKLENYYEPVWFTFGRTYLDE